MSGMRYIAVIVFILLFESIVCASKGADKCPSYKSFKSVDIRNQFGPVRSQGGVGWCYAYAAADLLTNYLHRKGRKDLEPSLPKANFASINPKNVVSAVGIAYTNDVFLRVFLHNKIKTRGRKLDFNSGKDFMVVPEGGYSKFALKRAMRKGFYFDSVVLSSDYDYKRYNYIATNGKSYLVSSIAGGCGLERILNHLYQVDHDKEGETKYFEQACNAAKKLFPKLSVEEIRKILRAAGRDNAFDRLIKACSKYKYVLKNVPKIKSNEFVPKIINLKSKESDKLLEKIDNLLDRENPVPVVIGYYAAFLDNPNPSRKALRRSSHASVIVGKRLNNNCEKEYIVRNSYDDSCFLYINQLHKQTLKHEGCSYKFKTKEGYRKALEEAKKECKELNEPYKDLIKDGHMSAYDPNLWVKDIVIVDSEEIAKKMQTKCEQKNPLVYYNPNIACDAVDAYLYVKADELRKYLFDFTYIED